MLRLSEFNAYRVYVWGYGYNGKKAIDFLQRHHVLVEGIIDKNGNIDSKKTTKLITPDELVADESVIIIISSNKYGDEIRKEARERGFSDENIIDFSDIDNVGCANSSNRDQWIISKLKGIPQGLKLLDAGAGECKYKKYCKHLVYTSQDFGEYDGQGDDRGLQTGKWDYSQIDIVSDITDIPVEDETFDAILCSEVLEHIPSPENAIKEFERILKPGGLLLLTAPFCSLTHFAPYHYTTGFNKYWYERVLDKYSFEIVEIITNGNYFEYIGQELRRLKEVVYDYTEIQFDENGKYDNAIKELLDVLKDASDLDKGSDELLCYGYHIVAKKMLDNRFKGA